MATFKFDLTSFSNKCRDSFLIDASDKSNALWLLTPNIINCTCGRIINKKHITDHLSRDIHKKYTTSDPVINNTLTADSIIYVNYENFIKCNTCNVYIIQYKLKFIHYLNVHL